MNDTSHQPDHPIACLDVGYPEGDIAVAAGVLLADWRSEAAIREVVETILEVADYVPGEFYRRELPCLLRILERFGDEVGTVVVDGYVWLGDETRPGLGAHLWEALDRRWPVVGVSKSYFRGAGPFRRLLRGTSARPLFVSAAGVDLDEAAACVAAMAGEHRLPTMLRRLDRLSKGDP